MAYERLRDWRKAARVYDEAIAELEGRKEEGQALEFARENRQWISERIFGEEPL